ncbi:MAG: hypothetical protein Homavirus25_4 [Homavirus sp.]|uniref:Uncharacterized protein n=1 Tax=Homavirus sp. TaxID=2487769 RepID=A0A3G5A4X9_9VIRU|nr:MAG: hypothetical protein Homavirus25_4 [Homavirus sp.]
MGPANQNGSLLENFFRIDCIWWQTGSVEAKKTGGRCGYAYACA